MSQINIPPPTVTLPNAVPPPPPPPAPVINPTAALRALAPGTQINATVQSVNANTGVVTVTTANQGTFSFNSPIAVSQGASLSLTVQGTPNQPQVVASVVSRGIAQGAPAPLPPLVTGSVVEGVLVTPAPTSAPVGATPAQTVAAAAPIAASVATALAPQALPQPVVAPQPTPASSPAAQAAPAPQPAPAPVPPQPATSQQQQQQQPQPQPQQSPPQPAPAANTAPPPPAAASEIASTTPPPANASTQAAPPPPPNTNVAAGAPPTTAEPTIGPAAVTLVAASTESPTTPLPTTPPPAIAAQAAQTAEAAPAPAPATTVAPEPAPPPAPAPPAPVATTEPAPAPTAAPPAPTTEPTAAVAPAVPDDVAPLPVASEPAPAGLTLPPPPSLGATLGTVSPQAALNAATVVARAVVPITGSTALVTALISQEIEAAIGSSPAATANIVAEGAIANAVTAVPAASTTPSPTTPTTLPSVNPPALTGLAAGEPLLLRVVGITAPVTAATQSAAASPAALSPGTSAAAASTAGAAASVATTAAAQVQATAAPPGVARPAQPTIQQQVTAALPAQAASASGAVNAGAVAPLLRGDGSAVLTAEEQPSDAALAAAAAAEGAPTAASTSITPSAGQFTATVVGTAANGQPVLLAGQNLLTLRAGPLQTGSQVVLQVAGTPVSASPISGLLDPVLSASLPSLPELMVAAQSTGGAAQAAMAAVMPQPGPALAGQMAFYLSALQTGDIKAWIGETARTALDRAGRAGALEKVDGELKRTSAAVDRDVPTTGWRNQPIPFSPNGAAITPVQLYVHQTRPDDSGNAKGQSGKAPTRFLLDLNLSALGPVQLDGLAQPPRFDLILRTPQPLPEALRNNLRALFTNVTSARGLNGGLSFQVAPPIVPTGANANAARPGILV